MRNERDEPETTDEEELEEFLFYRQLEENGGKPSKKMALTGCLTSGPILILIVAGIFWLLKTMYL